MSSRTNRVPVFFEALENRMMLSAAPLVHHHHHHSSPPPNSSSVSPITSLKSKKGDPIFMNYAGITGDVTAAGFTGDIQINSFQFGVHRTVTSPTGGSANREASAPSVSEITITKAFDTASAGLFQESLQGEGQDVKIFFAKIDKHKLTTYLEYDLSNVLVSSYSVSSGGDRPSESITLNFTKIQMTAMGHTATGGVSQVTVGWDASQGKVT